MSLLSDARQGTLEGKSFSALKKERAKTVTALGALCVVGMSAGMVILFLYLRAFLEGTGLFGFLFPTAGYGLTIPPITSLMERWAGLYSVFFEKATLVGWGWILQISPTKGIFFGNILYLPAVEELLFRGPLLILRKATNAFWWYIPAIIFWLGYSFTQIRGPFDLFIMLVAGAALTFLVKLTGRLWPSVLLHIFLAIKGF